MTATTLQRPAQHVHVTAGGGATPFWRPLLVLVGVVVVLFVAAWSWTARPAVTAGPGEVALDGGVARVEQVASAARPQHAMPGMGTDNDPVAEGERRVSIDVTLLATGDEGLGYAAEGFRLEVPGTEPRAPHKSVLPGSELPAGTSLSGTLVFDVPVAATAAQLSYDGLGSTSVALPAETSADTPAAPAPQHEGADHS